jgi:hypothetical protein
MASPLGTSADRLDRLEDLLGLAVTVPYGVTRTVKSVTAATYTVVPSDAFKVLAFSHATPTVTIDSNANQPVPLGADIIMLGLNGPITLAAGSGVSIFGVNGVTVIGQNAPSRFIHQAANSWYLQASRGGDQTTIAINASGQFGVVASPTFTGSVTARIAPRVTTIVSSTTPAINTDNCDAVTITALAAAITSMTSSLTGTPANFDQLTIRIKDNGTARAIAWGASFASRGATLPTITVLSKVTTVTLIWNSVAAVWDCIAAVTEA